jgi:hypothetical protein
MVVIVSSIRSRLRGPPFPTHGWYLHRFQRYAKGYGAATEEPGWTRKYRETIPLRLTKEQARAIAEFAEREGISQAEAIRRLVERGSDRKFRDRV